MDCSVFEIQGDGGGYVLVWLAQPSKRAVVGMSMSARYSHPPGAGIQMVVVHTHQVWARPCRIHENTHASLSARKFF